MRMIVVIGTLVLAVLIAPLGASAQQGKGRNFIQMDGRSSTSIETLHVTGTLHLNVVQNANGTTLHANLSNAEALGETTGNRYKGTGAEKIPIPSGPGEIAVSPTYTFKAARANIRVAVPASLAFNLVLTIDSEGAVQSARLGSVTEAR